MYVDNYYGDGNRYVIESYPFPDPLHAVKLTGIGPVWGNAVSSSEIYNSRYVEILLPNKTDLLADIESEIDVLEWAVVFGVLSPTGTNCSSYRYIAKFWYTKGTPSRPYPFNP